MAGRYWAFDSLTWFVTFVPRLERTQLVEDAAHGPNVRWPRVGLLLANLRAQVVGGSNPRTATLPPDFIHQMAMHSHTREQRAG